MTAARGWDYNRPTVDTIRSNPSRVIGHVMVELEALESLPLSHRCTVPPEYLDVMGLMNARRTTAYPDNIATQVNALLFEKHQLVLHAPTCGVIRP
jgi:hypothetical protein